MLPSLYDGWTELVIATSRGPSIWSALPPLEQAAASPRPTTPMAEPASQPRGPCPPRLGARNPSGTPKIRGIVSAPSLQIGIIRRVARHVPTPTPSLSLVGAAHPCRCDPPGRRRRVASHRQAVVHYQRRPRARAGGRRRALRGGGRTAADDARRAPGGGRRASGRDSLGRGGERTARPG